MGLERCTLRFAKLTENAFAPVKGSAFAAGFDLRRLEDTQKINLLKP